MSGVLPSREQGKKTVFYEEGVVKYFMTQGPWKEASAAKGIPSKNAPAESDPDATESPAAPTESGQRVDINAASVILNRTTAAIYQLTQAKAVPYYKEGRKVYFMADELKEWVKTHPARKRRSKK
jgi:hypothetical protein